MWLVEVVGGVSLLLETCSNVRIVYLCPCSMALLPGRLMLLVCIYTFYHGLHVHLCICFFSVGLYGPAGLLPVDKVVPAKPGGYLCFGFVLLLTESSTEHV